MVLVVEMVVPEEVDRLVWLPVVVEEMGEVVMDQEEEQEQALSSVQVEAEDKILVVTIMDSLDQVVLVEDQMVMVMLQVVEVSVKQEKKEMMIMEAQQVAL